MSRLADNTVTPSTQSYHLRACTLGADSDSEVMVVTREFDSDRLKNPYLLHCFGTGTEPPDGFIIVYDPSWPFSLDEAERLLAAVVGASWGPRLVELEFIRRRVERDIKSPSSSSTSFLALAERERWKKRNNKFKPFPRLPYDLQRAIIRACLVSPEPIIDQKPHLNGINMNLLLVNKFCYEEGGTIFKTENRFLPLPPICIVADSSARDIWDSGEDLVQKGKQLAERVGIGFFDISCQSRFDVDGVVMGVVREFVAREERVLRHRLQQNRRSMWSIRSVGGIWNRRHHE